jgi:anti-sigma regulatory factor (Ser/Thr protein kinase)
MLSELINNCVLHGVAARPEAWIDIAASIFQYSVKVEVCDGGPAFQHEPHAPNPADVGPGPLPLVEQLASRWGMSEHGRARVWFELPRAEPAPQRPDPRR